MTNRMDWPLVFMAFLFLAMAVFEYWYPPMAGGERIPVKVLNGVQIAFAMLLVFCAPRFLLSAGQLHIAVLLLFGWLCVSGFAFMADLLGTIYFCLMFLYWCAFYLFFFSRAYSNPEKVQPFLVILVLSLPIWLLALVNTGTVTVQQQGVQSQNYLGYFFAALFPYALLLKSRTLKAIAFLIIAYGSMYSLKRGVVLALFLMGMSSTFLYVTVLAEKPKRLKRIIVLMLAWGVAVGVAGYFMHSHREAIDRRIAADTGRGQIYAMTLDAMSDANAVDWIIGHGARKAERVIGHYTHNDWLLLLFDYGLIGVALMLNVYFCLFILLIRLCRSKSTLAPALLASLVLMACVQLYSIGLFLKLFGIIMGGIGLVAGAFYSYNRERKQVNFRSETATCQQLRRARRIAATSRGQSL